MKQRYDFTRCSYRVFPPEFPRDQIGLDIFAEEYRNEPDLIFAAMIADMTKLQQLLDNGADIKLINDVGSTALEVAVSRGHAGAIEMLLNKRTKAVKALVYAIRDWNEDALQLILIIDQISSIFRSQDSHSILHWAATKGSIEMVTYLLDKGVTVDAISDVGATPLAIAVKHSHGDIIQCLLRRGASVQDEYGDLAKNIVQLSVMIKNIETMRMLLDHKADSDAGSEVSSPLVTAAFNQDESMMQLLL